MQNQTPAEASEGLSVAENEVTSLILSVSNENGPKQPPNNRKDLAGFFANQDVEPRDKFVAWLATPPLERWPKTQKALAKLIGVNPATLSEWKQSPEFAEKVNAASRRYASFRASEFVVAVFNDALRGDWRAREMVLKILGWDAEKPTANVGVQINDNRTAILVDGKPAKGLLRVGLVPDDTDYSASSDATTVDAQTN